MGEDLVRCCSCKKTENSPKVSGWSCNLCTDRSQASNESALSRLSQIHKSATDEYEELKAALRISEERARQQLAAADKMLEIKTLELRDMKDQNGSLLESESFSDLSIEVEGQEIKAHKCILVGRYVFA